MRTVHVFVLVRVCAHALNAINIIIAIAEAL